MINRNLCLLNLLKCDRRALPTTARKTFHTAPIRWKWPTQLRPATVREKKPNVKLWESMTVWDLAKSMRKDMDYIKKILEQCVGTIANFETGEIYDIYMVKHILKKNNIPSSLVLVPQKTAGQQPKDKKRSQECTGVKPADLVSRPPVVTIMGHVDHGKTTLLDALRNSNIVEREFGGITQHIGAFSVALKPGMSVTFIDTPGHAAFTAMRCRGANVTDIVVLIVAADDGVMEQTIESIHMARNAGAPIIVAVNKMDKAVKNLKEIKQELLVQGLQSDDMGGQVQVIPISALKRINLEMLIEAILLEAEMLGLSGDPKGPVEGVIIESSHGPNGKVATIIVNRGTLRRRMILLAGTALAKVRAIFDENGQDLPEVSLSQPAQIVGWRTLPTAGDKVIEIRSEKEGNDLIKKQKQEALVKRWERDYATIQEKHVQQKANSTERRKTILKYKAEANVEGLKEIFQKKPLYVKENEVKLNIIIKGDVDGSVDAILKLIDTYDSHDECKLKVIQHGVGVITENDVELSETFNAIIYCFNLAYPSAMKDVINEKGVDIRFHNVIYKLFDDLKSELQKRLPLEEEEHIIGMAEVGQHFQISERKKKVSVAGSTCIMGEIRSSAKVKVERNGEIIFDGNIRSLKHFKNQVSTVKKDNQCGIMLHDFNDNFRSGDKIICYVTVQVQRQLKWDPGF